MKRFFNKHNITATVIILIGLGVFLYPWLFKMPVVQNLNYKNLQKIKKADNNSSSFLFAVFGDNKFGDL